ncbi:MAG: T9SS type A sorting domain-containing protein, partial [Sphingobacteriales bacterium]
IDAKGSASGYSYWDNSPVTGKNYYRLKMMEPSGAFNYSQIVTATVKDANAFSIEAFPNPVKDVVTVKVYGSAGANATVSLTDVTGKVIRVAEIKGQTASFDMNSLASGFYLIKYSDNIRNESIKISKQ